MNFLRKLFSKRKKARTKEESTNTDSVSLSAIAGPGIAKKSFLAIWNRNSRTNRDPETVLNAATEEIRQQIYACTVDPAEVAEEIIQFVLGRPEDAHLCQNRQLLLAALDVLATYDVQSRLLVRKVLAHLYQYSRHIDREVLLFDYSRVPSDIPLDESSKTKRAYVLSNTAGWVVDKLSFPAAPFTPMGSQHYYLELPFRREGRATNTHLLAEAMYRLVDPEFTLDLLRHGAQPSCLYLWPVAVMLDLKFAFQRMTEEPPESMFDVKEAQMIRYFCRARSYFYVHLINTEGDRADRYRNNNSLPANIAYEDTLLLPPNAHMLLPDDRHLVPASLRHQCRLRIRQALLEADCLPKGISRLPIPLFLKQYVDLLID